MSVSCPAEACEFTGMVDQVEGHIGGVADKAHRGVSMSSLQESLHGKASEGPPVGLILLLVLGLSVSWYLYQQSEGEAESEDSEGLEGSKQGERVVAPGDVDA